MKKIQGTISLLGKGYDATRHEITGYAVDIEGISAMVHKDHAPGKGFLKEPPSYAKWVVTELRSGFSMARSVTRDGAIKLACEAVRNAGGTDKVRELVDRQLTRFNIPAHA